MRYLILLSTTAVLATGQVGTSVVTGRITDPTGSAIPTARVKVVNEQSGSSQSTLTNDGGAFRVGSLAPGAYRVEVEADGFQKLVRGPVAVEEAQVLALDLALQLGPASETVNVTEAPPLVDSQTSNLGQVVSRQMLAGLP